MQEEAPRIIYLTPSCVDLDVLDWADEMITNGDVKYIRYDLYEGRQTPAIQITPSCANSGLLEFADGDDGYIEFEMPDLHTRQKAALPEEMPRVVYLTSSCVVWGKDWGEGEATDEDEKYIRYDIHEGQKALLDEQIDTLRELRAYDEVRLRELQSEINTLQAKSI